MTMEGVSFIKVRDKQGKTNFINLAQTYRLVQVDANTWQIEFKEGTFVVLDSAETQKLLQQLPGNLTTT
jgi:hypothetical protein